MKKHTPETPLNVFDFKWRVAAEHEVYEEKPRRGRGARILYGRRGWYIRPKGAAVITRPLDNFPALFKQFAETPKTPEGVREFANRFGMLDEGSDESFSIWYEQIDAMRDGLAKVESGAWQEAPEGYGTIASKFVDVVLINEIGRSRPSLKFRPRNLLAAMRLQFALWVSSPPGVKLRQCAWDGLWFMYGPGTGRRETAVYCSPKCQKAHQYAKRKELKK